MRDRRLAGRGIERRDLDEDVRGQIAHRRQCPQRQIRAREDRREVDALRVDDRTVALRAECGHGERRACSQDHARERATDVAEPDERDAHARTLD